MAPEVNTYTYVFQILLCIALRTEYAPLKIQRFVKNFILKKMKWRYDVTYRTLSFLIIIFIA